MALPRRRTASPRPTFEEGSQKRARRHNDLKFQKYLNKCILGGFSTHHSGKTSPPCDAPRFSAICALRLRCALSDWRPLVRLARCRARLGHHEPLGPSSDAHFRAVDNSGTCPLLIFPYLSFLLSSLIAELIVIIVFQLSCRVAHSARHRCYMKSSVAQGLL